MREGESELCYWRMYQMVESLVLRSKSVQGLTPCLPEMVRLLEIIEGGHLIPLHEVYAFDMRFFARL